MCWYRVAVLQMYDGVIDSAICPTKQMRRGPPCAVVAAGRGLMSASTIFFLANPWLATPAFQRGGDGDKWSGVGVAEAVEDAYQISILGRGGSICDVPERRYL